MIQPPHDPSHPATSSGGSLRYEAPRVVEDLPLESFSLTCTKSTGDCLDPGNPTDPGELQS